MAKVLDKGLEAQNERRKMAKERLAMLTDPMTGLFNRQAWDDFAQGEIRVGGVCERFHHVLAIDLEGMRSVNEVYGVDAGDRMILTAANVISEVVRDTDFVARWGGDEYAALLLDSPAEMAMLIKTRIHMKLGEAGIAAAIGVESTQGHDSLMQVWAAANEKMFAEMQSHGLS